MLSIRNRATIPAITLVLTLVTRYDPQCHAEDFPTTAGASNLVLGTQTFGVRYQFTDQTKLVETAEAMHAMGTDLFKGMLGEPARQYGLAADKDLDTYLKLASRDASYQHVFKMPFRHYMLWVMSDRWRGGLTEAEAQAEYDAVYELCEYLRKAFDGTNKAFYLGHWEGDWLLLDGSYNPKDNPKPAHVAGMIAWLNVRQRAIEESTRAVPSTVKIYQYAEVNLAQKAQQGGRGYVNDVLPHARIDFVSYSSYDTVNPHKENVAPSLHAALDYIEQKLPEKREIAGKRVFVGEYGFPLDDTLSPQQQDQYARDVCIAALDWGCPFVLYWEMYCNEVRDGRHRGFWLIDDQGHKQPFYFTLQNYYVAAREYCQTFEQREGRPPTDTEFRAAAKTILMRPAP
jgi:hypothetical protein